MAGLNTFILDTPHRLPCPDCGLQLMIALRQIRCEDTVRCPRCHLAIALDHDGAAFGEEVAASVRNLEDVADRLVDTAWRPRG